jgi:hypothetical protein
LHLLSTINDNHQDKRNRHGGTNTVPGDQDDDLRNNLETRLFLPRLSASRQHIAGPSCIFIKELNIMPLYDYDPRAALARARGEDLPRDSFEMIDPPVQCAVEKAVAPLYAAIAKLTARIDHLERGLDYRVETQVAHRVREELNRPLDPGAEFPPAERITKLEMQYFHNPGATKKAKHQLKVYVWTCPPSQHRSHREGTCGTKYIPLYAPGTTLARKRFGTKLDYLCAEEIIGAKWIGCLTLGYSGKRYDQAAVMTDDNRLLLCLRGAHFYILQANRQRADAKDGAAQFTWYWTPENEANNG